MLANSFKSSRAKLFIFTHTFFRSVRKTTFSWRKSKLFRRYSHLKHLKQYNIKSFMQSPQHFILVSAHLQSINGFTYPCHSSFSITLSSLLFPSGRLTIIVVSRWLWSDFDVYDGSVLPSATITLSLSDTDDVVLFFLLLIFLAVLFCFRVNGDFDGPPLCFVSCGVVGKNLHLIEIATKLDWTTTNW